MPDRNPLRTTFTILDKPSKEMTVIEFTLIIMMVGTMNRGGAVDHIEFATKELCLVSAQAVSNSAKGLKRAAYVSAACVRNK